MVARKDKTMDVEVTKDEFGDSSSLSDVEFTSEVGRVAREWTEAFADEHETRLEESIQNLDGLDLETLSEDEDGFIKRVFQAQLPLLGTEQDAVSMDEMFSEEQEVMCRASRSDAVVDFGYDIPHEFDDDDDDLLETARQTEVGDFYLQRNEVVALRVAQTLFRLVSIGGLDLTKGDDKPSDVLQRSWSPKSWEQYGVLAANAWLALSRNIGILSVFRDAGVERAKVVAVIDERTSHICRFLHQKEVIVSSAISVTAGLVEPFSTSNWLEETIGPRGLPSPPTISDPGADDRPHITLPPKEPGGKRRLLAIRTGPHLLDDGNFDMGSYDQYTDDDTLASELGPPPYHHLCRTLLVPVDWEDPLNLRPEITDRT